MNTTRRRFLQRFAGAIAGAYAIAHLPIALLPEEIRQKSAIEYLTKSYYAFLKKTPKPGSITIRVSQELFDQVKSETPIHWRFVSTELARQGEETLVFKGSLLRVSPLLHNWNHYYEVAA